MGSEVQITAGQVRSEETRLGTERTTQAILLPFPAAPLELPTIAASKGAKRAERALPVKIFQ